MVGLRSPTRDPQAGTPALVPPTTFKPSVKSLLAYCRDGLVYMILLSTNNLRFVNRGR